MTIRNLYFSFFLLLICSSSAQGESVKELLSRYRGEYQDLIELNGGGLPDGLKNEFYREWRKILESGLAGAASEDPARDSLFLELVAISSFVGEWEKAIEYCNLGLDQKLPSGVRKILLSNRATIASTWRMADSGSIPKSQVLGWFKSAASEITPASDILFLEDYCKFLMRENEKEELQNIDELVLKSIEAMSDEPTKSEMIAGRASLRRIVANLVSTGDLNAATKRFVESHQKTVPDERLSMELIQIADLVGAKSASKARSFLDEIVRSMPVEDHYSWAIDRWIANSYYREKQFKKAAEHYSSALSEFDFSEEMSERDRRYSKHLLFQIAESLRFSGEAEQAKGFYRLFLSQFPDDEEYRSAISESWLR